MTTNPIEVKHAKRFAFYDKPTSKARLIQLHDGTTPNLTATEVGADWRGEYVTIINEYTIPGNPPGRRWVAMSEKGSIFQDKPEAFTVCRSQNSEI